MDIEKFVNKTAITWPKLEHWEWKVLFVLIYIWLQVLIFTPAILVCRRSFTPVISVFLNFFLAYCLLLL